MAESPPKAAAKRASSAGLAMEGEAPQRGRAGGGGSYLGGAAGLFKGLNLRKVKQCRDFPSKKSSGGRERGAKAPGGASYTQRMVREGQPVPLCLQRGEGWLEFITACTKTHPRHGEICS